MKKINSQKGSIAPLLAIIVIIVIAGIWYATKSKTETPVTTAAPITLISPNGGETLVIGATTTVSFSIATTTTEASRVVIWLEEGAAPLATIPATTTSYSFVLPASILIGGDAMAPLAPGANKIRVTLYDGTPCTGHCMPTEVKEIGSDSSDADVMIATSTPLTSNMKKFDDEFGFSFIYPASWHISRKDGTVTVQVDSDIKYTISTIASTTADDSTGKWGTYKISYDASAKAWKLTSSNSGLPSDTISAIAPVATSVGGFPIFKGGIQSFGWGQYDYIVSLSPNKFIIVRGTDNRNINDSVQEKNPLLDFVKSITK
jgi:hypothetical protein